LGKFSHLFPLIHRPASKTPSRRFGSATESSICRWGPTPAGRRLAGASQDGIRPRRSLHRARTQGRNPGPESRSGGSGWPPNLRNPAEIHNRAGCAGRRRGPIASRLTKDGAFGAARRRPGARRHTAVLAGRRRGEFRCKTGVFDRHGRVIPALGRTRPGIVAS
jgi:hypothetical protein